MDEKQKLREAQDQFILEWGRMASSWGINRTMAQIHALLLATGEAYSVDEIIERLHISRGNASMNLRDLMDWGIIHRFRKPGDRKDIYQSSGDMWQVFSKVVKERKRRELDPTVMALRECQALIPGDTPSEEGQIFKTRVETLLEIFAVIDRLYSEVFEGSAFGREQDSPEPRDG